MRPGRVLIGGAALSVLLLAGAAIAGILVGRPDSQWLEAGSFVTSKDTGEQYVVLEGGDDPVIRRVPNYVSAQLLLGEADLTPFQVRDKYIREVTLGEDVGIDDAPASLPDPDGLIQDGWTACTAPDAGIKVALDDQPAVTELVDSAFLVRSGGDLWLLAPDSEAVDSRVYRFQLPTDPTSSGSIADQLGFGASEDAPEVSQDWLNLFPPRDALEEAAFGASLRGEEVNYPGDAGLSGYLIGDLVTSPEGRSYLLGDDGPQELSEFAATIYRSLGNESQTLTADPAGGSRSKEFPAVWPETLPTPALDPQLCAVLHPDSDAGARVALAGQPTGAAASDLAVDQHDVDVQPAGGAYVQSGSIEEASEGTPYVIDSAGYKYELIGAEVPGYIGYGSVNAPVVPSAWMDFFEDKVQLSTNAARRVSEDAPAATADGES